MALQKTIELPNGSEGNYIRIESYRFERNSNPREASAIFALFKDVAKSVSHPRQPLERCIFKLRLSGAKFDQYLATEVLATVDSPDPVRSQLYAAAKVEPVLPGAGIETLSLADATDV